MAKDEQRKELVERVGTEIVDRMKDEVFVIEGTPTVIVKKPDGTFRQKPMIPGAEFFLRGAYLGTRGKLNFIFIPADAQEYTHIEIDPKKLDSVFPDLGFRLGAHFEIGEEQADKVILEIMKLTELATAKQQRQKVEAEEAEKKSTYTDNPLFGMF
ncbi:hypothetical protein NKH72_21995 [Mesorhizobium sp. M0955]|uniref:hypothetical protein n=1 Tax=Mesorhizobium sp. M0955 TaxID=2957033 RepID=UPI003339B259